jgi:glycosyltransferase involved in cell wall biosynthesis
VKRPVSICHITIGHNPTDDRIFYKETYSLVKEFPSVYIIAPDREKIDDKNQVKFILFKEKGILRNIISAYKASKKINADIYHIHEFELLSIALILKYKYHKKIIYDAHEALYNYLKESSNHAKPIGTSIAFLAQIFEWLFSLKVDYVIKASPWIRTFNKKSAVIYNFPVPELFLNQSHKEKNKGKIIMYHGQLSPIRKIETMIEAMKFLIMEFTEAKLILIGIISESYKRRLMKIIRDNKLNYNVEIRKPIPHSKIPELLNSVSVGLTSMNPNESLKKAIELKSFEYMIMGIPVVGCRVPSTEIFIERNNAGLLIDPPTAENLGNTILYLLKNPSKCKELGENGKSSVLSKYNWHNMEERLLRIYKEELIC